MAEGREGLEFVAHKAPTYPSLRMTGSSKCVAKVRFDWFVHLGVLGLGMFFLQIQLGERW